MRQLRVALSLVRRDGARYLAACVASLGLVVWVACSGGGGGASSCTTGQATACACTDGTSGSQLCESNGTYGACVCTGGGSSGSGSGGSSEGGLTSLSQLNAIWTMSGQYSYQCNGVAENESISGARVQIFDGQFNEAVIALPTDTCNFASFLFQGSIDATGAITGTESTNGGNPPLSDTLTGSCSATSCTGSSANTGTLHFTLSNTEENPFDGTWSIIIACGDGTTIWKLSPTLSGGSFSQTAPGIDSCTDGGEPMANASGNDTLSVSITGDGILTGTLNSTSDGAITFAGTSNATATVFSATSTFGSTLYMSR